MAVVKAVSVTGLRDFQAALREMDAALPRQLRLVLNEAANVVVEGARPLIPQDSGKLRSTLKAASGQREAKVKLGGARAPYAQFIEFGGSVGRGHVPGKALSGAVRRKFIPEGRSLYPTLGRRRDEIEEVMIAGLTRLARESGLEVTDGD